MPMMASQFSTLAEQAVREKKTHLGYLEALLTAEMEERERNTIDRRIKEARLPRVKTLEEFDFNQSPHGLRRKMRELAEGGYIDRAEPVLVHRRMRNREDASSDRTVRGGLPAEAAGSFHDGRRIGE